MSGLASHGRGVTKGVLRRTVSNPVNLPAGLINEVKQRADAVDPCRNIWTRNESEGVQLKQVRPGHANDTLSDFRCLEQAINDMEEDRSSYQRCFEKIEDIIENVPSLQLHNESTSECSTADPLNSSTTFHSFASTAIRGSHNPLPDGPVYSSFQRELSMLRGECSDDRRVFDGSPPRPSTPSSQNAQNSSNQLLQSQLDEARASNRVVQRALASVQVFPVLE